MSVLLVPVIAVYGADNGNKTFDPRKHKVANGQSVIQNTVNSPLFTSNIDYIQGGTDLGTTQFIDAFQRAIEEAVAPAMAMAAITDFVQIGVERARRHFVQQRLPHMRLMRLDKNDIENLLDYDLYCRM